MTTYAAHEQDASNAPINPSEIIEVTPLQMVTLFDLITKRPRTMHARRTIETTRRPRNPNSGQISQSSVPSSREEPTKEGSRYNHNAIVKIVTEILNEDNVSSKIPGPKNPVLPKSNVIGHVSDTAGTYVPTNDEINENVHVSDKKRNDVSIDHIEIPDGVGHNEEIPSNVSTNTCVNHSEKGHAKEKEPEKTQTDKVINLDDLSDDDLVASINPSIARRLMRREGKQDVAEVSLKKKAGAKSVSVGPKKVWSKVVPKKRKARSISENESDSDVAVDVNDIHPKKKVSTSKLAASVPEVPIDNISFHYPSSTVTQLSKCYEVMVKEFIVNLHEDCGNKETEEYLKVFARGKCINFSPTVINKFLERSNEAQPELEVFDNQMCKEITVGQVKTWPVKGKFIFAIGTKSKADYGTYIFKQTLKHAGSYSVKGFGVQKIGFERLISSLETSENAKSAYTAEEEQGEDDDGSDNQIEKEASPDDGTDNSVELSSSESED
ncbi:uncharacterized protein LOC131631746 [Vicia villosa]|uniref:uncharacterized protein LOC131631746 n=1 Tax=Vicia villosa TaxID=3911 RepID=UPI00273C991F|nr:uncharacterized protein LOC131631746 [Vicia villosa]